MRRTTKLKNSKKPTAPETEQVKEEAQVIELSKEEFETLKTHIETLQKEKDETVALAQRLQADFDNFRKRNASVYTESREEGIRAAISELLPILDGFDRAFQNTESIDASWGDGIKLLHKQMIDQLSKLGLEEIPTDTGFNPEFHEAVMQVESEEKESGDIVDVYRKGYKVKDKIIRHSMVIVAK